MPKTKIFKQSWGFTLVELMISISIIAILTIAAIPSFSGFSKSQVLAQAFKSLKSDLRVAQSRSLSGATVAGLPKAWGINFTDGLSAYNIFTCTPAQLPSDYSKYRYSDPSCGLYKTIVLVSSIKINGLTTSPPPTTPSTLDVVFDSQNGSIYANGNQVSASIGVSYADGSGTQIVTITSGGGISD